jgi:hypothetical protein
MAKDFLGVDKGIKHKPESAAISYDVSNEGAIYNETNSKLHVQIAGADREILNNSQVQSMTNKHIDSDLNEIINIVDADIKAAAGILESKLALDHSTASLYATGQANSGSISSAQTQLNHVQTLSGMANGSDDLGTFTGTTIPDNSTIKAGMQSLETATETAQSTANAASSSAATVSGNLASHVGNTSNPHSVTKSQILTGNLIVNTDVDNAAAIAESKLNLDYSTASLSSSIASTAGSLSGHIAATSAHGVSGSIVGTSDVQVLTNKDIDGGAAANNRRITVPKDLKANLDTLTRKEGTIVYGSDSKKLYVDNGTQLVPVGSGGAGDPGALIMISAAELNGTADIPVSGKNANFDGGGSLGGAIAVSSIASEILFQDKVIRYSNSYANNQNDYFGWSYTLPQALATLGGITVAFEWFYKNSAAVADNSFRFCVKIVGGTQDGVIQYLNLPSSTATKQSQLLFSIPQDATGIKYGFQNIVTTATLMEFFVDRLLITADAFGKANLFTTENWTISQANNALTNRADEIEFDLGSSTITKDGLTTSSSQLTGNNSGLIYAIDDPSNTRTKFVANRNCKVSISFTAFVDTANLTAIYKNGSLVTYGVQPASNNSSPCSTELSLNSGEYFSIGAYPSNALYNAGGYAVAYLSFTAFAESPAILIGDTYLDAGLFGSAKYPVVSGQEITSSVSSTSYTEFPVNSNFPTPVLSGKALEPSTKIPAVRFANLPAGTYLIMARALIFNNGGSAMGVRFTDGTNTFGNNSNYYTGGTAVAQTYSGTITYNSAQSETTFRLQVSSGGGTAQLNLRDVFYSDITFDVYYFPPNAYTKRVVALPASKVNDFSAKIANGGAQVSTYVISQGPTQWISSVDYLSGGHIRINFVPGLFGSAPAVVPASVDSTKQCSLGGSATTSSVLIDQTTGNGASFSDGPIDVVACRQGSDASSGNVYVGNVPGEQIAILKDVKPQGTNAGTFSSGAWRTRDLNTVEGSTGIVSLSSNQFTLGPGEYYLFGRAPTFGVSLNQCRIYNITNSSVTALGTSGFNASAQYTSFDSSMVACRLSLTATKTFELQHYCSATGNSNGFGFNSNFASEVYSTLEIRKLS